jgi:hypothetical protein
MICTVILLWGLQGGVWREVVWRLANFRSCNDMIVVRVKVSRGIFSPKEIDSADSRQPPNGEICMDK